jgi:predicted dehydrogenase
MRDLATEPAGTSALRVGLVGFGSHMAENLFPALRLTPAARIVALSSRDLAKASILAARHGLELAFDDWRRMIDSGEVDAVVVSATPQAHAQIAAHALSAGVHVFIEKPPAPDLDSLRGLIVQEREATQAKAFVGYNFRFAERVVQAARLVGRDEDLRGAKIRFVAAKPLERLWGHASVEEAYLYAVAIHAIDLVLGWFGRPRRLQVSHLRLDEARFSLSMVLEFADDRQAVLDLGNYSNRFENDIELIGADGRVARVRNLRRIELVEPAACRTTSSKAIEVLETSGLQGGFAASGYASALAAFVESARTGAASPSPIAASLPVYEVIEECVQSLMRSPSRARPVSTPA